MRSFPLTPFLTIFAALAALALASSAVRGRGVEFRGQFVGSRTSPETGAAVIATRDSARESAAGHIVGDSPLAMFT